MEMTMSRRAAVPGIAVLVGGVAVLAQVSIPRVAPAIHDIRPGGGWATRALSDYDASLAGTAGDTPVFVFEGLRPGGTVFVAGGTHGNEPAGYMATTLLVERARVETGRLIVVPRANNSAASWVDPKWTGLPSFSFTTPSGVRTFKFGARLTKPEHQGEPDPPRKDAAGAAVPGPDVEARNLDRAYPGNPTGNLTQRVAAAIVSLIKREQVDLAFDLHEAGVDSRLAMMIVANPKNIDLGAAAVLSLEGKGLDMKLEASSSTFRGLSHREWGDATQAKAFLFETPNPASDAKTAGDLVNHPTWPLSKRVGIHLTTMAAVIDAYNADAPPSRQVTLAGVPDVASLTRSGLNAFLR
jgi:predicted deacylase